MTEPSNLQEWIDHQLAIIAEKLPQTVHQDPASFACGYNSGYKAAMLDLERFLYRQNTD